jgi:hypothetical protein
MSTQAKDLETDGQPERRPVELSVTYRQSDGELRAVVIAVDVNNLWTVYDIPAEEVHAATGVVVEHLTGPGERLGAALGVLVPYVKDQVAFHNGQRERHSPESPLPREPQEAGLAAVRRDAKRALEAAEADRQRGSAPENAAWLERAIDLAEQQRAALGAETQAETQAETETQAEPQPLAA